MQAIIKGVWLRPNPNLSNLQSSISKSVLKCASHVFKRDGVCPLSEHTISLISSSAGRLPQCQLLVLLPSQQRAKSAYQWHSPPHSKTLELHCSTMYSSSCTSLGLHGRQFQIHFLMQLPYTRPPPVGIG